MNRTTITTSFLLFLIIADVSYASPFWNLRFLADESPPNNDTTATNSQLPTTKKLDPKPESQPKLDPNPPNKTDDSTRPPVDKKDPKSDKPEKEIPPQSNSSSTSNSTNDKKVEDKMEKEKNIDSGKKPNSTEIEQPAVPKEDKNKKTNEDGNDIDTETGVGETCDQVANSCKVGNSLTACIKGFETGSKQLVVLVHNSGEKTLKINLAGPSGESLAKGLKVLEHGTRTINIPSTFSKSSELLFSSGNEDCVLRVNPLESDGNFFLNLPSYEKLLTPINGAYILIATVVILGASWACWMFRKRRRHDGVPYQELEMGLPVYGGVTVVETAEGWDQDWDSDWDEDKAVKSPAGPNISANGLSTRSSNRDGWENDWDD